MTHFPISTVRNQFPALATDGDANGTVYLDNPAGTQVPGRVAEAVSRAMLEASSNHGGFFHQSHAAEAIWLRAHEAMADMLGATTWREIVVGPSMTTLTLHLSRSIGRELSPGDEIIVTRMDHEGDISPWLLLAEDRNLVVRWLPFNRDTWRIEPEDLQALLSDRTRVLALNYASNLTGSINEVSKLAAMAKAAGALVYVDAVQLAPHRRVDVESLGCDFLVCSSYKFYGPHLGILWGRGEHLERLTAYKCRCASNAPPGKFETGTPQTELLAGLEATVDYLTWLGAEVGENGDRRARIAAAFEAMDAYETGVAVKLIEGLQALNGTTIHGITNSNRMAERVPTVSLTHGRLDPQAIAKGLGSRGICVWSGHNYAYEPVRHLGLDERTGVVRVGLAHYNTADEVERTLQAFEAVLA
jgi:cysteine desulfurase family protein (TIGR01976 family)